MPTAIDAIVTASHGAFRGKGWQGTTLSGSLRGVTAAQAAFRPAKDRKCIWEHAVHAAYWKHIATQMIRRALGELADDAEAEPFPRSPSNWARLPSPADDKAWARDRALLAATHRVFIAKVKALSPDDLSRTASAKHKVKLLDLLVGVAAHDAYHTGQIQLLKRLQRR